VEGENRIKSANKAWFTNQKKLHIGKYSAKNYRREKIEMLCKSFVFTIAILQQYLKP